MRKTRPEARYEDGRFVPPAPVPRDIAVADYNWRLSLSSIFIAIRNPLETFSALQYSLPISQYVLMGNFFTAVFDPDVIKHIMITNRQNYIMSPIRQRILRPILGEGLISAEGEVWKHARHTMASMFTPRNVGSFGPGMSEAAQEELLTLFDSAGDDGETKVAPLLSKLTYMVLSETLFSGDIERGSEDILQDVATALLYMGRPDPFDFMNAPDWVPRLTKLRGLRAVKRLRRLINEINAKRRIRRDAGEELPDDFLSRLLLAKNEDGAWAFTDRQVQDHMISFIGAGHETTARALVWMLYLLSHDNDARQRAEAEIDALDTQTLAPQDWPEHLPWTTACLEETMRLYPPAPLIARKAVNDDEFGLLFIPERTQVLINSWILHRNTKLWDHPNTFMPERFFGDARAKIGRFQYLPFGAGERVCIGQRFAMQEAIIILVHLMRKFRFDYEDNEAPWPVARITVQPHNDMPMRVTRRSQP